MGRGLYMRDWKKEFEERTAWLNDMLAESGTEGFVFGNSGGKDSALVGILCRSVTENTLGVIMPCESVRNYREDRADALKVAAQFGIATKTVDITSVKKSLITALGGLNHVSDQAAININPRLRMTVLYAVAQSMNRLVVGTGNRSEITMGYFTKWGDGAFDINPVSDLTATEILDFLRYLDAPPSVINKAPSAGLREGQTDEADMGVTYAELDSYLLEGKASPQAIEIITRANQRTQHKRTPSKTFK